MLTSHHSVTHIIQLSLPTSPAQYIHRLGRTARAGASGEGILILMPDEEFFLRLPEIASLPITPYTQLEHVAEPQFELDERAIGQAYAAWLGFYKSWLKPLRWTPAELVKQGAVWAQCLGWPSRGVTEPGASSRISSDGRAQSMRGGAVGSVPLWTPPPIAKRTVGMMGLRGTPGLNVVDRLDEGDAPTQNRGGGPRPGRGQPQQQGGDGNKTTATKKNQRKRRERENVVRNS
jgi:ATP-dependent RNA helicase MSS116